MAPLPRISVVTPSLNQGRFIGRTVESVLSQNYANLEHIVVDGLSTDETPAVLARYPHLRVVRQKDRGQADAINTGFQLAGGDILCFLNSDDTYLPGALHRVAREIDPTRGRHVVVGCCIHIDENDTSTGVEHAAGAVSRRRILEVWKGNCIPQPATFWTAEAWRNCGPLDAGEHLALDYDLMCRLGQRYRFHFVDQVLATYRLHARSKSCSHSLETVYEAAIRVSRRSWGSPGRPQYWRLWASLAEHRLEQRLGRRRLAARLAVAGHEAWQHGSRLRGSVCRLASALLAPAVACRRLLARPSSAEGRGWAEAVGRPNGPLTRVWRAFRGIHSDRWVGPTFVATLRVQPFLRFWRCSFPGVPFGPTFVPAPPGHRGSLWLYLEGCRVLGQPRDLRLGIALEGRPVQEYRAPGVPAFSCRICLTDLEPGDHLLTVSCDSFIVPHDYLGNEDHRPLSFRLQSLEVTEGHGEPVRAAA
jgi:hypothetical protein